MLPGLQLPMANLPQQEILPSQEAETILIELKDVITLKDEGTLGHFRSISGDG
jgi:hypothetical protein